MQESDQKHNAKKTRLTWKCKIMVHINPNINLGFPSVMSSFLMLTSFTCHRGKKIQTKLK